MARCERDEDYYLDVRGIGSEDGDLDDEECEEEDEEE